MTRQIDQVVTTPDGPCDVTLVTPSSGGPWPAVIVYMDVFGVRPALLSIADDLATAGYAVLVPDLFHRHESWQRFDPETVFADDSELGRLLEMASSVTTPMAVDDTGAFLSFLDERPEIAAGPTAATGYCMGGGLALAAAAAYPDRITAVASFHGGSLATDSPDSPHRVVGSITGRVLIAAAENDPSCPPEQLDVLSEALRSGDVDHVIETYPASHGFALPDLPSHDVEASARHHAALRELCAEAL